MTHSEQQQSSAQSIPLAKPLAGSLAQAQEHFDVIVIGSGYGGAVSASRLARAGKRVCVLERGAEFLTGDFPTRFPELRLEFQVTGKHIKTGKSTALYDIRLGEDMHVLVGCGLGGGSLINAGVALRPDPRVFADAVWPNEISGDAGGHLAEGFARAARWLRPARHDAAMEMTKSKALQHSASAVGGVAKPAEVVVSFQDNVNPAGVFQPACTLCGDCCGGCNVGAKNTVALSYLPDAVNHGAQIFTFAPAQYITKNKDGSWGVKVVRLGENGKALSGADGSNAVVINADNVIISAGTLGSVEILLRSAAKGLAISDRIGHGFSANGDIIAFGYGAEIPVNAVGVGHPAKVELEPVGACVSSYIEICDKDDVNKSLNIQEGVMPSALAPALPAMFVPNGRLLGALKSLIAGVYKGPFKHLQTFFAVSHDSASGVVHLRNDRLILSWPNAKDEPAYARLDEALESLTKKAGASYVKNPLAGTVMGHQPATAHPLGGCAMGRDNSVGVVNHKAQVFIGDADHDGGGVSGSGAVHAGLYVIDGSIMPRSLGVNPLYTITALAERAMILMAADKSWRFDDAPVRAKVPGTPQAPANLEKFTEHQTSS